MLARTFLLVSMGRSGRGRAGKHTIHWLEAFQLALARGLSLGAGYSSALGEISCWE